MGMRKVGQIMDIDVYNLFILSLLYILYLFSMLNVELGIAHLSYSHCVVRRFGAIPILKFNIRSEQAATVPESGFAFPQNPGKPQGEKVWNAVPQTKQISTSG